MIRPRMPAADVIAAATTVLSGARIADATPLPVSFTNETWHVTTTAGAQYVIKIGALSSEAKWRSAHRALALAASVDVPVAPLVGTARHADHLVRAFEWIEGETPDPAKLDTAAVERLFTDLGRALRSLHSIELDAFTSRLDGSAPSFERWPEYVGYRLSAIKARCRATRALDEDELTRVSQRIASLASEVGDFARPTLCHRDLHPENLLVDPTGRLAAILDFDGAEAWDRAADFDKLDRQLVPGFPGARRPLDATYLGDRPRPPRWDERVRLVALLEALNTLPNAIMAGWSTEYADDARRRMRALAEL